MAIQGRYLFSAAMDVDRAHEALFNEVYDTEHVPELLAVPGVIAVARFKRQELGSASAGRSGPSRSRGSPPTTPCTRSTAPRYS